MDLNIIIDLISAVCGILLLVFSDLKYKQTKLYQRTCKALVIICVTVLVIDIASWSINGRLFPGSITFQYIVNILYFLAEAMYCYVWIQFVNCWNYEDEKKVRKYQLYYLPIVLAIVVITVTTPINKLLFYIDSTGTYVRGKYFLIALLFYSFFIIGGLIITIVFYLRTKDKIKKRRSGLLIVYMILPIIANILQTLFYGISIIWPFTVLSLIMISLTNQRNEIAINNLEISEKERQAAILEEELKRINMEIMISQIQPHFLYNTLNTIKYLCETNPKAASNTISNFSKYLKMNMDSLSETKPISFSKELEHLKSYVDIEMVRFDNINIVYDLQITDFDIPALTVQPLVENSIKYGLREKENGGTIKISTKKINDHVLLAIEDDGVGFDILAEKDDGRNHIGIMNTNERIERMSNGTFALQSVIGVGTKVNITLPISE